MNAQHYLVRISVNNSPNTTLEMASFCGLYRAIKEVEDTTNFIVTNKLKGARNEIVIDVERALTGHGKSEHIARLVLQTPEHISKCDGYHKLRAIFIACRLD